VAFLFLESYPFLATYPTPAASNAFYFTMIGEPFKMKIAKKSGCPFLNNRLVCLKSAASSYFA